MRGGGFGFDRQFGFSPPPPPAVLGPELLVNGDFGAGATGWTVNGTDATHFVTFAGGTARYVSDTTSPTLTLEQLGVLVIGEWYELVTVCSAWVSGSVKISGLGGLSIITASRVGTTTLRFQAAATTCQIFRAVANIDLTLDRMSARRVVEA